MKEIERKFLVDGDKFNAFVMEKKNLQAKIMVQKYICRYPGSTARVRLMNDISGPVYIFTWKGKTTGISRTEIEFKIPRWIGKIIMAVLPEGISKVRYILPNWYGKKWEIDCFRNDALLGLKIAEIELKSEDEEFVKPDFVLEEVSDDPQYYNSRLLDKVMGDK